MLEDKVIYITGGSSGIGLSIAKHCLKNNAQVVITGRNEERLEKAKKTLSKFSPDVVTECFDISDPDGLKRSIDNVYNSCLLYTSPSPRDATLSRMPSSA